MVADRSLAGFCTYRATDDSGSRCPAINNLFGAEVKVVYLPHLTCAHIFVFSRAGAALVDWIPVGEDPDEEDERLTELLDPIGMPQVKVFHVNFGTNCNF